MPPRSLHTHRTQVLHAATLILNNLNPPKTPPPCMSLRRRHTAITGRRRRQHRAHTCLLRGAGARTHAPLAGCDRMAQVEGPAARGSGHDQFHAGTCVPHDCRDATLHPMRLCSIRRKRLALCLGLAGCAADAGAACRPDPRVDPAFTALAFSRPTGAHYTRSLLFFLFALDLLC